MLQDGAASVRLYNLVLKELPRSVMSCAAMNCLSLGLAYLRGV